MPNGEQSRSDDASRDEPFCPSERLRGTHVIDHSDHAFNGLPDLETGRTLEDAIARLDWVRDNAPAIYGREWLDEMRDIGLIVQRVRTETGPMIEVDYPCDAQLMERRRRGDEFARHFREMPAGRDLILDQLAKDGSVYGYMMGRGA